ncbi:MAG: hypothetical protein ACE15E_22485 [Acidobacteriota bacterium]
MRRNALLGLWLAAVLLFVLACVCLPRRWQYSGEGNYLLVNLVAVWALITLVPAMGVTVWWFRRRE